MTSPTTNKEPLKKDSPEIEEPKKNNNFTNIRFKKPATWTEDKYFYRQKSYQ